MRLYLPKSIDLEIEHWQRYRKEHILPAIKEDHSEETPVSFLMELYGKNYDMPLEVTGYRFRDFIPLIKPTVLKNMKTALDRRLKNEDIAEEMKKYIPSVHRASPSIDYLRKYSSFHSKNYDVDMIGKIIGGLLSVPIKREDFPEVVWLNLIQSLYENLKSKDFFKGWSSFERWFLEPMLRGNILDYADIFASVIFYEGSKQYVAYSPDKRKYEIFFIDMTSSAD
jgi:hypothetical protein